MREFAGSAERYIVDVLFDRAGEHAITNRVRALNHVTGTYYQELDTLGSIAVSAGSVLPDLRRSFERLRVNQEVVRDIDPYRRDFGRAPDRELVLSMRTRALPPPIAAMASGFPVSIDWNDVMGTPHVLINNAVTGGAEA